MRSLKIISPLLFLLFQSNLLFGQIDSMLDQGVYRKYILHKPMGYNANNKYPLVLNFHGLNSNASQQQYYTKMDSIADIRKFVVVYPQGINNTWEITGSGTPNDFVFVKNLVNLLSANVSIDSNCVFATGMSMGAFMCYTLVCTMPVKIKAIAPVSGNMVVTTQLNCPLDKGIPVLHIHGTADPIVSYNGAIGIPPVETTIAYWVNKDVCDTSVHQVSTLPDIAPTDGCTVNEVRFYKCRDNSEVVFYKINNGGHTWPGASTDISLFGNTCRDFNASAVILDFFLSFCSSSSSIAQLPVEGSLLVFPNPSKGSITVSLPKNKNISTPELIIYNSIGQKVFEQYYSDLSDISIDVKGFNSGIYTIFIIADGKFSFRSQIAIQE